MKHFYILILLISFSLCSQNVIIEADTSVLRIGEQFDLKLKVFDVEEGDIIWPQIDSVLKDFDVIDEKFLSSYLEYDTHFLKNYVLTSFDTGKFIIDSMYVVNKLNDTLFSNSLLINFIPTPLDTTDNFFPIKPLREIPFLMRELLFYSPYFLLFLLICLCVFIFFRYFNRKKNQEKNVSVPSVPIDIYFLNKLKDLQKKKYLEDEKYKYFYTELSEIFRGYLELRFNISALESTSNEVKKMLYDININEPWFVDFFRNSDIVKFAKGVPSLKESKVFLKSIRIFIESNGASNKNNVTDSV